MIYFKQDIKTHNVFGFKETYSYVPRKKASECFVRFNSLSNALEDLEITLSQALGVIPEGEYRNSVDRLYQLCSQMNSSIISVADSLSAYLRAPHEIEKEQSGFIRQQVTKSREYLKTFPWQDVDNTLGRIDEEECIFDIVNHSKIFPEIANFYLEELAKFYIDREVIE